MRIALISDIHANEVALKAVLKDIRGNDADQVYCLGDVANLGPSPASVLGLLRDLQCPCIMGNHDAFLLDPDLIHKYTQVPVIIEALNWSRSQLSASDLAFIRTFAPALAVPLASGDMLYLYHGSPRSYLDDILPTTAPRKLERMLDGHRATVFAGGHTHIQMLRQHRGSLIVNPGSVGQPFLEYVAGAAPTLLGHAEYAWIEANRSGLSVHLRRVPIDRAALRKAASASDDPLREWFLMQYA